MKAAATALILSPWPAAAADPLNTVVTMLSDLQAKTDKAGKESAAEYSEFAEWCTDRTRQLGFEIKTGTSQVEELTAAVGAEESTIESLSTKIDELAGDISANQDKLDKATAIRKKEQKDFGAEEKELVETIDMLTRAASILERNMQGGASMVQLKNANSVAQALTVMLQASLIDTNDATKLSAFVQSAQSSDEDDSEAGAPAAAGYESKTGGLVDTIQDLQDKAEAQLADVRKTEATALNNFELLKQSLDDEIKFGKKDMDRAKKGRAGSAEKKSVAEGDLQATSKELGEDKKAKETVRQDCLERAEAQEAEQKSRSEELKALGAAKKVILEIRDGGDKAESFLQLSRARTSTMVSSARGNAVRIVRGLGMKYHSSALMQLASRMNGVTQISGGADPFAKVKGMISDMLSKLEAAAEADATKKAYCDKEMSETKAKKDDKTDDVTELTTKIEQAKAKSSKLKEEVAALEADLSKLTKAQAEMDKIRQEEKTIYEDHKAGAETAIAGIQKAIKVLSDYYGQGEKAHDAGDGAAAGIIGLLESTESSTSKFLAEINADEEAAAAEYNTVSKENEIEKTTMEQDVKYKVKESKELDKSSAEMGTDLTSVKDQLAAVVEYLTKIEQECVAKAESYEVRAERRANELAGLKQALQILEEESALVQRSTSHRTLRGVQRHVK